MKSHLSFLSIVLVTAMALPVRATTAAVAPDPGGGVSCAFTVSMPQPASHYYHVELRYSGESGGDHELRLPMWTPGFYVRMDYAKDVGEFEARDERGRPLSWEKKSQNCWLVHAGSARAIVASYDVYAFPKHFFEICSSLDDGQAFISPTGLFMYPAGHLQDPVTLTVELPDGWSKISTGLDAAPGSSNTFTAPDFDTFYDCPVLAGNQAVLSFDVQGIPYEFAARDLGSLDRDRFVADLQAMIREATGLFGDVPYDHYSFLVVAPGWGGLEHLNSQAITFDCEKMDEPKAYRTGLSLLSHEFFHAYNVKRIRPLALGPFDYDRENYTRMLWFSEGITSYYGDLLLLRAGLFTPEEYFERAQNDLKILENGTGHEYQSAVASSFDTWFRFFDKNDHQRNRTISYYRKGMALGFILDFAIRHQTDNRKSLDDVMRALYRNYYQDKGRGFSDEEFRATCEKIAGGPLKEFFDVYVATTQDIDYRKYFAYAGLDIDTEPETQPGAYLGVDVSTSSGKLEISHIETDSPAARGGLSVRDELIAVDGTRVDADELKELLLAGKPGDEVELLVARRRKMRTIRVELGTRTERSFEITQRADVDAQQRAIRESWMGKTENGR